VKTAAVVVLALLALLGYHAYERTGKMSAKQLETILNNDSQNRPGLLPTPGDRYHMTCAKETSGKWDYVCTEVTTGTVLELDVNRSHITRSSGPEHPSSSS
jgi:hypothetical protein